MATASLRYHVDSEDAVAPVTLLWVRPDGVATGDLDRTLHGIVERYSPMVRLQVVAELPEDLGRGPGKPAPTLLVLRRGQIVGEAMGTLLPARELDRVVRCAVEWPSEGR